MVERDTRLPQAAQQRKAWAELARRFGDGGLSDEFKDVPIKRPPAEAAQP